MNIEAKRQKAIQFFIDGASGRIDAADLSDDFYLWNPLIGKITGAQMSEMAPKFGSLVKGSLAIHIEGTTAEGNRVAIEARSEGELVNGIRYANTYHVLIEFDDSGKVKRMSEHLDSQHMAETVAPLLI